MTGPADEWQALCKTFSHFSRRIDQAPTININANSLRAEARDVAQRYFRQTRPVLQNVDQLAPDDAVTSAEGYVQEKGRSGQTMKQKVRFILKARGQSKSSSGVPEQTTTTVDEMVGTLTRSVYDRSSVATHVASERRAVIQIRRYVVAVLHDILEL
jgi:hypothetical protein